MFKKHAQKQIIEPLIFRVESILHIENYLFLGRFPK